MTRGLQIQHFDGILNKLKGLLVDLLKKILLFLIMLHSLSVMSLHPFTGTAHAIAKPLKTDSADPAEVKGIFTVILLGGAHVDDLETVAFLDKEDDQYTFEPFTPDFDYVIKKGLPAEEALEIAEKFVAFHPSFWKIHLAKIIGPEGTIIGFELKPLYIPFTYGTSDVLAIHYWPKGMGKIKVTIKLISSLETLKFHPGGTGGTGGRH